LKRRQGLKISPLSRGRCGTLKKKRKTLTITHKLCRVSWMGKERRDTAQESPPRDRSPKSLKTKNKNPIVDQGKDKRMNIRIKRQERMEKKWKRRKGRVQTRKKSLGGLRFRIDRHQKEGNQNGKNPVQHLNQTEDREDIF